MLLVPITWWLFPNHRFNCRNTSNALRSNPKFANLERKCRKCHCRNILCGDHWIIKAHINDSYSAAVCEVKYNDGLVWTSWCKSSTWIKYFSVSTDGSLIHNNHGQSAIHKPDPSPGQTIKSDIIHNTADCWWWCITIHPGHKPMAWDCSSQCLYYSYLNGHCSQPQPLLWRT